MQVLVTLPQCSSVDIKNGVVQESILRNAIADGVCLDTLTNKEKLEIILPKQAKVTVDKNSYVHIRGIKGDWLEERGDSKMNANRIQEQLDLLNEAVEESKALHNDVYSHRVRVLKHELMKMVSPLHLYVEWQLHSGKYAIVDHQGAARFL